MAQPAARVISIEQLLPKIRFGPVILKAGHLEGLKPSDVKGRRFMYELKIISDKSHLIFLVTGFSMQRNNRAEAVRLGTIGKTLSAVALFSFLGGCQSK